MKRTIIEQPDGRIVIYSKMTGLEQQKRLNEGLEPIMPSMEEWNCPDDVGPITVLTKKLIEGISNKSRRD